MWFDSFCLPNLFQLQWKWCRFYKIDFFTIGGILAIVGISELLYLVFPSMNSLSINQHEIQWRGLFSSGKVSSGNVKSIEVIHSLESLGFIRLTLNSNKTIKIPESFYGEFDSDLLNAFKIVCPEVEISENYTLVNT